jgi:hypothetical protein
MENTTDNEAPVPSATESSSVSVEAFNAMKTQLEARNQELADARAQGRVFEERERQRVGAWKGDVQTLLKEFMERGDPELKADIAPLEPWASEYVNKNDIIAQRPLARVMCEASRTIKREREEASVNKEAATALSKTMKQLENVTGERDNLKQRLDEMSKLADERQDGMLKLQEELTKAGLLSAKHDFSKILNREQPAADAAKSAAAAKNIIDTKQPETNNTLESETSQASRKTLVNPLESDPLLNLCMRGQGRSRIVHSSTNHMLLGNNANTDLTIAALRAF